MTNDFLKTLSRISQRWVALLAPVMILLIWEALVRGDVRLFGWVIFEFEPVLSAAFFARPSEIGPEIINLYKDGALMSDVWDSLVRVCAGFVLGAVPAIGLGLLM
jgi:NitT/TauT family transport system permease protein